uniref:Transaldolase n=1 Tax=Heterorhabditis bacteriophora TaxID=37862 RepID=A0A1I7WSJ4_HETBA
MASLCIRGGLNSAIGLPQSALVIIGKNKYLKQTRFEGPLAEKFGNLLDEAGWQRALELVPISGSLPLVFNQARGINTLNVVLYAEYAHVLASVAAVARSFPLYSLKTKQDDKLDLIELEVVVTDGKELREVDVSFLSHLVHSIRETGRLIDMPANYLTTNALVLEALKVAKGVGAQSIVIQVYTSTYFIGHLSENIKLMIIYFF